MARFRQSRGFEASAKSAGYLLMAEITAFENDPMQVREKVVVLSEAYSFTAASVTALELTTRHD